jgi:hypothetical protein
MISEFAELVLAFESVLEYPGYSSCGNGIPACIDSQWRLTLPLLRKLSLSMEEESVDPFQMSN